MAAHETLTITSLSLLWMTVYSQIDQHPTLPPFGCENFGVCRPASQIEGFNYFTFPPQIHRDCRIGGCMCNEGTLPLSCLASYPDQCFSNPCAVNGGQWTCKAMINNYECTCRAGYTGSDCTMLISNPCSSSPCENGGTCKVVAGEYFCECPPEKAGDRCQYDNTCYKYPNTCDNGGTCEMVFNGENFYCNCGPEYQGRYCKQKVNQVKEQKLGCWKTYTTLEPLASVVHLGDQPTPAKCLDALLNTSGTYDTFSIAGAKCFLSLGNIWNETKTHGCNETCSKSASGTEKNKYPGFNATCGSYDQHAAIVTTYEILIDPEQCENKTCTDGMCVEFYRATECVCPRERRGAECEDLAPDPCVGHKCAPGSMCQSNLEDFTYKCICGTAKTGKFCDETLYCASNPCKYGSKCVENGTKYLCECLQYYMGDNCDKVNFCASNPCNNGNCNPLPDSLDGLKSSFNCSCFPGWTGQYCTTDINECATIPCKHGGKCTQIKPPAEPFYECACVAGTTGKDCETNPNDCEPHKKDGKIVTTCAKVDSSATCDDGFESFTCVCGPQYTGPFCDIDVMIYDILMKIYGKVNDEMLAMLKELLENPSMIKDMVPFILGLEDEESRSEKSWDHEDLFEWASYEEERLELTRDLVKWNDVTLGNCFTFNHRNNSANNYMERMTGQFGGFYALMRINGEEYFPWVDTEAIQVFVHPSEDDIFSESVRYNAQPNGETEMYPYLTEYGRLAGKYGVCVKEPSEVKAYYYTGAYTTDGCLRSCYQNAVQEDCDCMDPRYPMPDGMQPCDLQTRNCVEDVTVKRGDPSKWRDCVCPLPCENRQYSVRWSRSAYVTKPPQCELLLTEDRENCTLSVQDTVLVRVTLASVGFNLFQEEPAMDFQRFIGNLGGLLGVLCGISIITFIEIGFLIVRIWIIVASNK